MENINDSIGQPFWDVMTNRVEKQEEKIVDLEKKVNSIPDNSQAISVVIKEIGEVKRMVSGVSIPRKDLHLLNTSLNTTIGYLSQPMASKVEHHHHFPRILIICAILFVVICIVITGWVFTYQNLGQYKENDTKYRFLKIQSNKPLQNFLFETDSLYNARPNFRGEVIWQEDSILDRFKRIQEIDAKEKEVKDLKKKLK